ncbi:dihydrofolate reductase [Candidatus Riesia pediculischaeffi]|uniref:dihydrofolate reductase n=2 Tax=Candidatus Riesia pediculischaeffi TaxID=428411 RepID=A0A1V0HKJ9_9ENTR|nr:dihydrofolate reductase [Candidatus Riesia pediculischaeffi]ARC53262.1 hypothetical protein AOQ87_00990 [Candidatus Riesia pediculischaeffi]KIE64072.1 Dihydrofolate reductase [Candidatus Riesia pediculischaeffi PTSU]
MKKISLISAVSRFNSAIGYKTLIPWKLSNDIKWFKRITVNKPVIVGRTTHEIIGKLPMRMNIVLSRDQKTSESKEMDRIWVSSVEQALSSVPDKTKEIMIIGGEKIYRLFFPIANRLYITYVDYQGKGDTFFPSISKKDWICSYVSRTIDPDRNNSHRHVHKIFKKRKP